jgi:hypothetical protein
MLLGTGSSSEVSSISEATLLMTCTGNTVLEQDMVNDSATSCLGKSRQCEDALSAFSFVSYTRILRASATTTYPTREKRKMRRNEGRSKADAVFFWPPESSNPRHVSSTLCLFLLTEDLAKALLCMVSYTVPNKLSLLTHVVDNSCCEMSKIALAEEPTPRTSPTRVLAHLLRNY